MALRSLLACLTVLSLSANSQVRIPHPRLDMPSVMTRVGFPKGRQRGSLRIQGVLLDVDGLLYSRRRLHLLLGSHLLLYLVVHPGKAKTVVLAINTYRRAQEALRIENRRHASLDLEQLRLASQESRIDTATIATIVDRWMGALPLRFIRTARRRGLLDVLSKLRNQGLRIGVFSDYPCAQKLQALGIEGFVDSQTHSMEAEVGVFKPNPRGFDIAAQRLGLDSAQIAYVGDRPDVDGSGAEAAGMIPIIVGRKPCSGPYIQCQDLRKLPRVVQESS